MIRNTCIALAVALMSGFIVGCDSKDANNPDLATSPKSSSTPAGPTPAVAVDSGPLETTDSAGKKFTFKAPSPQPGDVAVVTTNLGTIKFELMPDKAPGHVANFEKLADAGFYDGTKFHRVIPGFMIQAGDPNTRGADRSMAGGGGPGYTIKAEFNDTPFVRGIVGMARTSDPDSAGSQFFIMVADNPGLNNQYTAFGKVTDGMAVADKIVNLPRDPRDNPNPANPAIIKSVKIVHAGAGGK